MGSIDETKFRARILAGNEDEVLATGTALIGRRMEGPLMSGDGSTLIGHKLSRRPATEIEGLVVDLAQPQPIDAPTKNRMEQDLMGREVTGVVWGIQAVTYGPRTSDEKPITVAV